jgi:hypothetical protein
MWNLSFAIDLYQRIRKKSLDLLLLEIKRVWVKEKKYTKERKSKGIQTHAGTHTNTHKYTNTVCSK